MAAIIELIYFSGCPNIESARQSLKTACAELGLEQKWTEWNLDHEGVPGHARGYSSPSILVDGESVLGDEPSDAREGACSAMGAPPASAIVEAVRRTR